MTPAEAAALLAVAAAFDNRKPDADAATAWAAALDDLRFEDCRDAIVAHYRESNEWLMPSSVRTEVRRIRHQRLSDFGQFPVPPDLDLPDELEWRAGVQRAIADGTITSADQLEARGDLVQRDMPELKALLRSPE